MTIHWKTVDCGVVCFFNFAQFVILVNLSILDLALSGVKGLLFMADKLLFLLFFISCPISHMIRNKSSSIPIVFV